RIVPSSPARSGEVSGRPAMAKTKLPQLQAQIRRASRRLQMQSVVNALIWCWAGALLMSALWCLAEPWVIEAAKPAFRWQIAELDIPSKFPLQLSGWAVLVPVAAFALAMIGLFYEPAQSKAGLAKAELTAPPANAKEIDQKMQDLKRKKNEKNETEKVKSED